MKAQTKKMAFEALRWWGFNLVWLGAVTVMMLCILWATGVDGFSIWWGVAGDVALVITHGSIGFFWGLIWKAEGCV